MASLIWTYDANVCMCIVDHNQQQVNLSVPRWCILLQRLLCMPQLLPKIWTLRKPFRSTRDKLNLGHVWQTL